MMRFCTFADAGRVMPKIRPVNLVDEWTYGRCAHRQDRADKLILRGFVKPHAESGSNVVKRYA